VRGVLAQKVIATVAITVLTLVCAMHLLRLADSAVGFSK
jgi:hypothetical protein